MIAKEERDLEISFGHENINDAEVFLDYKLIRLAAHNLAKCILTRSPQNEERDIAISKVREAAMWAYASISTELLRAGENEVTKDDQ